MSDPDIFEKDLFGQAIKPSIEGVVARRFGFPPFTVLDAKTGDWQERKRAWISIGIQSEVGRDAKAYNIVPSDYMGAEDAAAGAIDNGTSIFDPTLCEVLYKWFCPGGGQIVDPFSGGSVRGIVAASLGFKYWGCDLRREQVDANIKQGDDILAGGIINENFPAWVCGDSAVTVDSAPEADLIFSCPPYGDLEKYSDHEADLSAMSHAEFLKAYEVIIAKSIARLKNNRFAVFVVGDFRDEKGFYRNFPADTIAAFQKGGARLYNEAVILTSVGSACMRVSRQFAASRKFAKTHQNIIVFCKGDPKKAAQACGEL